MHSRTAELSNSRTPSLNPVSPRTTELPNRRTLSSLKWYVIWTRSHSEQIVHDDLQAKGFNLFLPRLDTWVRRHGMRHRTSVPMFPGYVFLHHAMDKESFLAVVKTRGIVRLLGERWDCLATVPDPEIEAIQRIHAARFPTSHHPYLREGQRVRITDGVLAGVEGILLRGKPNKGLLIVSVELLQRSVAVQVDCTLVSPV
jgi:transcription antitermination factor NusG